MGGTGDGGRTERSASSPREVPSNFSAIIAPMAPVDVFQPDRDMKFMRKFTEGVFGDVFG